MIYPSFGCAETKRKDGAHYYGPFAQAGVLRPLWPKRKSLEFCFRRQAVKLEMGVTVCTMMPM